MATFCVVLLLSAMSTTFPQTFLQTAHGQSILTPSSEAIKAFSQIRESNINSPFLRFINYSSAPNSGKDCSKSDDQLKPTNLNSPLQQNAQEASGIGPNKSCLDRQFKETDFNSRLLSEFSEYNLQVQKYANIYPRLYNISFSPKEIKENFYNEIVYFALENGLYEVGSLPRQLADAFAHALPRMTPLEYFKVISNALELSLQKGGIATERNYQVLARLNAKSLKDAMDYLKVNDAQSALHAIVIGGGKFFKSLGLITPGALKYILLTLIDELSKVPTIRNV